MRWFRRREQPEPTSEEHTAFSDQPWTVLVTSAMASNYSQGIVVEASRRVVRALEASERSATELGKRIWWLNAWLLAFTVAVFLLTGVLVWATFREEHRGQAAGGAWVLWGYVLPNPAGISGHAAIGSYDTRALCEEARRQPNQLGNLPVRLICLPDTVDPRGPKGK